MMNILIKLRRSIVYHFYSGMKMIRKKINTDLQKYYFPLNPKLDRDYKPTIIFMVDGKIIHGGLSDRLRAMTSLYKFAVDNNYRYKIFHVYPFPLDNYLLPNKYDWRISENEISYSSVDSTPVYLDDLGYYGSRMFFKRALKKQINGKYKQYHVYTNIDLLGKSFSCYFNELFKPIDSLNEVIIKNKTSIGKHYVSMTFRFQQLLGDFKEGNYPILNQCEQKLLIERCINKILDLYKRDGFSTVLVTSDSSSFLCEVSKLKFVYVIPGKVVHMDYTADSSFGIYQKSFVDMFMIAGAEKVYLLVTGQMYKSGFAKRAALINMVPYEEIIF